MKWTIKRGEMLDDLIVLLKKRKKTKGEQRIKIEGKIIERHAMPWYEGDEKEHCQRRTRFVAKSIALIRKVASIKNRHKLSQEWMSGICDIEEGYLNPAPSKQTTLFEEITNDELIEEYFRIWLWTGGNHGHKGQQQWACTKALQKRLDEKALELDIYQDNLQETAEARFLEAKKRDAKV